MNWAVPEIWFAAFAGAATRLSATNKPAKIAARIRMGELQSEWSSPPRCGARAADCGGTPAEVGSAWRNADSLLGSLEQTADSGWIRAADLRPGNG
jgi:hypothetical protein